MTTLAAPVSTPHDVPMKNGGWPRLARCADCEREVLLACHERSGRPVALEPMPVLVGVASCGECHGRGEFSMAGTHGGRTSCRRCHGTGVIGERLSARHVVVTLAGDARAQPAMIAPWDSAYQRHRC